MRLASAPLLLSLILALPAAAQVACTGLACQVPTTCATGTTTTISGVVYAPNGLDPLPDVLVYIPNAAVDAFTPGVSCPIVGQPPSGSPITGATTGADGSFQLVGVPAGANIPLVIQTGRWRRQVSVPMTTACADTSFSTRMPRNRTEGDIPKIAVATGSADSVECVLLKVGIDQAEFTDPSGPGRVNLYLGSGSPGAAASSSTPDQSTLMGTSATLNGYDVLMLPCEGGQFPGAKSTAEYANLISFANAGGRVYSSHFSFQWMYQNPPFNSVVNWIGSSTTLSDGTATIDQSFSEGRTLAQWLAIVIPGSTPGQIAVSTVKHDFNGVNAPTQSWMTLNNQGSPVMQFVFNTPIGQTANQCGRVLYNEYHVENPVISSSGKIFPAECQLTVPMTPQEKLLEFSLFDLTADGNAATLTPTTQDFGSEPINFTTGLKPFIWTNNSTFPAAVNLLTASGDFIVANANCGLVAAGGSCTIQVGFKPTATGARTGLLTVGSSGSTLTAALTGSGIPDLVFNFSALTFGSLDVGATLTKTLVVTNNANGPVNVPGLSISGDFSVASTCGSSVPAMGTCQLAVTFKPTTFGPRTGMLTVNSTDPAYTGTPTALSGNGYDYLAVMTPTSGSVIAGLVATTSFVTTPEGGFYSNLALSCAVTAPGSTCTVSNQQYGSTTPITTVVTITTTPQYAVVGYGGFGGEGWLWMVGIASGGLLWFRRRSLNGALRGGLILILVAAASLSVTGCSGKLPAQNAVYTVPGTYTYTVTATDGFLSHSATYALNVTAK